MHCSTWNRVVAERPIGSAATAKAWLVVEQPGPWGARAPTSSAMDPALGADLDARVGALGARLALIRRPSGADHGQAQHRVFAACSVPGQTFLLEGTVDRVEDLLPLDLDALVRGDQDGVRASLPVLHATDEPLLLVCVNGKRDLCCALLGRPTAHALHDQFGETVWEANHLGGHRFAPTTVLLPHGYSHAGVDPRRGAAIITRAREGSLEPEGLRGRSCWAPAGQVAELAAREHTDEWRLDAVKVAHVRPTEDLAWDVDVTGTGTGTARHTVAVTCTTTNIMRPESCGKADASMPSWTASVNRAT